ncbi:MAG: PEP-CTERM sorting domain-containing protein [Planctomycetales bacterium]|nr:PEP-CTERM sorting domain-containing protein [Planctomycetales bacterium]
MKWTPLALAAAFAVAFSSSASAAVLLTDDFDSYADTAALNAVWNETPAGLGTLDTAFGNGGQSLAHLGGASQKQVFAATVPTDAAPIVWEFDFYDDGEGNKRLTGGLRDNGAGAALGALLEMGRYNDLANPETGETTLSGYGVRTVFVGGTPGNWATYVENPAVTAGWHHFKAVVGETFIDFSLDLLSDGSIDGTRTIAVTANAKPYNVARLGGPSDLSSVSGGWFDNISIVQVPEPTALALAGIAAGAALIRRRKI